MAGLAKATRFSKRREGDAQVMFSLKQALSNLFEAQHHRIPRRGSTPKAKENYRGRIAFNEKTCINWDV